mgnify:CR=1 FL=1
MKRYRHYKKNRAIVLSCFGSIIEQQKYLDLKKIIEEKFPNTDVFLSFSSRMVLKFVKKQGLDYKNLPQVLADVDLMGYKHIVVSSINIFPTDEHAFLQKIVKGFSEFSLSHIRCSDAILTKAKETTLFLKNLNNAITREDVANLYIIHGTPRLEMQGIDSISYAHKFLEDISDKNYTCSLEGSFPFYALKEILIKKMKSAGIKKIQIVPMLLVSGNHYEKDMFEIKDDLSGDFEVEIVKSITQSNRFNLIEIDDVQNIILQNIKEEITKSGI